MRARPSGRHVRFPRNGPQVRGRVRAPRLGMRNAMKDTTALRLPGAGRTLRASTLMLMLLVELVLIARVGTTAAAPAPATRSNTSDFRTIDAYVEAEMRATRLPGVALAIVHWCLEEAQLLARILAHHGRVPEWRPDQVDVDLLELGIDIPQRADLAARLLEDLRAGGAGRRRERHIHIDLF